MLTHYNATPFITDIIYMNIVTQKIQRMGKILIADASEISNSQENLW